LLGGTTACLGQALSSESDAPIEQYGGSEELAICAPHFPKRREASASVGVPHVTRGGHPCVNAVATVAPTIAGHRLANGLRAPLRC
jgi:hypothetical protein